MFGPLFLRWVAASDVVWTLKRWGLMEGPWVIWGIRAYGRHVFPCSLYKVLPLPQHVLCHCCPLPTPELSQYNCHASNLQSCELNKPLVFWAGGCCCLWSLSDGSNFVHRDRDFKSSWKMEIQNEFIFIQNHWNPRVTWAFHVCSGQICVAVLLHAAGIQRLSGKYHVEDLRRCGITHRMFCSTGPPLMGTAWLLTTSYLVNVPPCWQ